MGIIDNLRKTRRFRCSPEGREVQRRMEAEPFLSRIRPQKLRGWRLWTTLGAVAAFALTGVIWANAADHLALVAVATVLLAGAGGTLFVALWVDLTLSDDVAGLLAAFEENDEA